MRWTKAGLGTAKFSFENFLNIKLCQLTKYQDQNFTSSDIDGQERTKKRERVKYKKLIFSRKKGYFLVKQKAFFVTF